MRYILLTLAIGSIGLAPAAIAQSPGNQPNPNWRDWVKQNPTYPGTAAPSPTPTPTPSSSTPTAQPGKPSICPSEQTGTPEQRRAATTCRKLESLFGSEGLRQVAPGAVSAPASAQAKLPELCRTYLLDTWKNSSNPEFKLVKVTWLTQPIVSESSFPGLYLVEAEAENVNGKNERSKMSYSFFIRSDKVNGFQIQGHLGIGS